MKKVITGRVRLSYVHLERAVPPKDNPAGPLKFSVLLLIPKTDTKTLAAIKAAQEFAIAAAWPKRPPKVNTTMHDGDGTKENGEPYGKECAGNWVMTVTAKDRPGLVDKDLQPMLNPREIKSGDYGRVSINAYTFDFSGKRGVSFGLNNVQKLEDGAPLGNARAEAEDDFATADDDFLS